jgi:hypothetical protein
MEHMTAAQAPLVLAMMEKLYAEVWRRPENYEVEIAENERRRAPENANCKCHLKMPTEKADCVLAGTLECSNVCI